MFLILVAPVLLAGCTGGSSGGTTTWEEHDTWTYSAGGQGNADESGRLEVPTGKVRAHLSVGGQASIHLIVADDDGEIVLRLDCSGSGGCSKTRTSQTGDPGDWSIEVKGLYNGGVSVSVQPV